MLCNYLIASRRIATNVDQGIKKLQTHTLLAPNCLFVKQFLLNDSLMSGRI